LTHLRIPLGSQANLRGSSHARPVIRQRCGTPSAGVNDSPSGNTAAAYGNIPYSRVRKSVSAGIMEESAIR
jgi:hypothetical protein